MKHFSLKNKPLNNRELIENAVDAGSRSIEVRLDNHGLNKISVKDDGQGVKKDEMPLMTCKSYTSKINQFSDISSVSSYGFRGKKLLLNKMKKTLFVFCVH